MIYDVIIIGSGLSGLICANILSREGLSVCVLEKNKQFGGCLQTFKRKGVEFDTGVHYIGSLGKGEYLYNFFKYFGIMDKVKFKKMDEDCFDKISFKNKEYCYAMGFENFAETLKKDFPKEKYAIDNYVKEIVKKVNSLNILNLRNVNMNDIVEPIFSDISTLDFLNSITNNYELQNVLAGTNTLYANKSERTSFFIHSIINHSYIQSSWRHIGGSKNIVDALLGVIDANGGAAFKSCDVRKLYLKNSKIDSVELENGEILYGKNFISSIHPYELLKRIDTGNFRKSYVQRINNMDSTISSFGVYVKFKENKFKFLNYNYYDYYGENVWEVYDYKEELWPRAYTFMTPPNFKDMEFANSSIIIALMNYNDVKKWENTNVEHRGEEYLEFKKRKAEKVFDLIEKKFSGFQSSIDDFYTSTPLTYRDYTATRNGSLYGIVRDCREPFSTFIPPRTKIPNLFLTGQNINFHGVLGVTIGSIITCGELIGINYLIDKIRDNN